MKRRDPSTHKRAMFGASVFWLTAAFDRFTRPFGLDTIHPAFWFVLWYVFPLSLLAFDVSERGRPHAMSVIVVGLAVLLIPVAAALFFFGSPEELINLLA